MVNIVGHRIEQIPEVPLVLEDKVQEVKKTKEAVSVLRKLNVWPDIEKVIKLTNLLSLFYVIIPSPSDNVGEGMYVFGPASKFLWCSFNFFLDFYFARGVFAKYCDEHVCVCLSVCLREYLSNHMHDLYFTDICPDCFFWATRFLF